MLNGGVEKLVARRLAEEKAGPREDALVVGKQMVRVKDSPVQNALVERVVAVGALSEENVIRLDAERSPVQNALALDAGQGLDQSPRGLGQSPKDLGQSPRDLGQSPRDLGQSLRDLAQSPRDLDQSPRGLAQSLRDLGLHRGHHGDKESTRNYMMS